MPNQLYGRVEQPTPTGTDAAKQKLQPAVALGQGQSPAGSQQAADSPYANFEDIFNKNTNYAGKAAGQTVGGVTDPLGGLQGRVGSVQTLAPRGQAESLGLPGYAGPNNALLGNSPGQKTQDLNNIQAASDVQVQKPTQGPAPSSLLGGFGEAPPQAQGKPDSNSSSGALESRDEFGNVVTRETAAADQKAIEQKKAYDDVLAKEAADAKQTKTENENLKKYQEASKDIASYQQDDGLALMQEADPNATIWDAGMQAQAGGRDAFDQLEETFGGYDQEYAGQIGQAQSTRQAELQKENASLSELMNPDLLGGFGADASPTATPGKPKFVPEGFTDIESFVNNGDPNSAGEFNENMHQGGLALSPADWLTRGLGEAGVYSGPNATELFAGQYGNSDLSHGWQVANVRTAFQQMAREYGMEAARFLWDNLTPEMWQIYMSQNSGKNSRDMRAWLEGAGYKKQPGTALFL